MARKNTAKTKKIWKNHFGVAIPKDSDGRSYEIHHIDGDSENDDIDNLICLTIHEHYDIHYWQEDWMACHRMSKRLEISTEETSRLGKLAQQKRVLDGTHNFIGGAIQHERVANGTHHLIGGSIQSKSNKKQWDDGTHALIGMNDVRIAQGTHNWLGSDHNQKRIEAGTHNWIQTWTCEHCGKQGKNLSLFHRWGHNDGKCLTRQKK
jgi:hypothetical protein